MTIASIFDPCGLVSRCLKIFRINSERWIDMLSINFCKLTQVLGLLVVLLIPFAVSAQVSGGTVSGKVTDSTGALIPGAQVAIRNTATGVTTSLVANEEGIYRASNLLAGDYEITASAPNFTSFLQKGLTLTVDDA